MPSSNCCFLTCIQVSLEVGKVVWYSYLLKNFSQFVVIHSVKSFCVVNETEADVFLEFSGFFYDSIDVSNLISDSSEFLQKFWEDSLLNLCIHNEVAQLCWALCDPMDCSQPGSTDFGILQARILERVAISFSRRSSQTRDWTQVSCTVGRHFTIWATKEVSCILIVLIIYTWKMLELVTKPNCHYPLKQNEDARAILIHDFN